MINTVSNFGTDELDFRADGGAAAAVGRTVKDGYRIRLAAEQRRIPCCTSLDTAAALVDAIGRHTSGKSVRVATVRAYREGVVQAVYVTADLSRAALETGEVLVVERLGGGLLELVVRLPHLAETAMPGSFAQLRCGEGTTPLLRRPFSVAWTQDDTCGFVFEAVGAGTRLLSELQPGDPLDTLGPLGHGFSCR